jgi:hypothetical protein
MSSIHVWKAELYDNKLAFVSDFGKGVVELLNPIREEKILDLGCGTGGSGTRNFKIRRNRNRYGLIC